MQVFSGWSLTIFIFRVFLLLQLNIYWEVNFGVQHFLCGCIPQSSRYLKPHLDAVIAKPHLTDSGQCTKVKPMVGFLRPLSPSERADSQQVQGRALNSWWDIVSDRLGHGTGEWAMCHNHWAHVQQPLNPKGLEPVLCNKRSHHNEKPAYHNKQ